MKPIFIEFSLKEQPILININHIVSVRSTKDGNAILVLSAPTFQTDHTMLNIQQSYLEVIDLLDLHLDDETN